MTFNYNFKYKDYELRARPNGLAKFNDEDAPNETIELVKWCFNDKDPYCFTIAYWKEEGEGYNLHFIGERFIKYILSEDVSILWKALASAQSFLDSWYAMSEEESF